MGALYQLLMRRLFAQPYVLLTLAALFWGGNGVASRMAVGQISPMSLTWVRWVITLSVLLLIARDQIRADVPVLRQNVRYLVFLGVTGFTSFNALMNVAAYSTPAVNLTILQGAIPVFVLIGGFFVFGTSIRPAQALGVLATLAGIGLIASKGDVETLLGLRFATGDVLMLIAGVCYAAYTLGLSRRPNVSALGLFAALSFVALCATTPMVIIEWLRGQTYWPTPTGWAVVAYVTLFPSLLAQVFYMRGVEMIGPGRAGIFVNLVPVFGAALAVIVLSEPFGWYQAAALVLVLGGIAWAQRK